MSINLPNYRNCGFLLHIILLAKETVPLKSSSGSHDPGETTKVAECVLRLGHVLQVEVSFNTRIVTLIFPDRPSPAHRLRLLFPTITS